MGWQIYDGGMENLILDMGAKDPEGNDVILGKMKCLLQFFILNIPC